MAGSFNFVLRIVIENKLKILLSRFVEINGFTFINVTQFSLKVIVRDNHKTSVTANYSHNFLFWNAMNCLNNLFLMESTFVSSSEQNSA
jgi:hypothetical protein